MDHALSKQLREKYQLDVSLVSLVMIGLILLALFFAAVISARQIFHAARVPTIRLQRTGAPPELPFATGNKWHMFLSQCVRALNTNAFAMAPSRYLEWLRCLLAAPGTQGRTNALPSSASSPPCYLELRSFSTCASGVLLIAVLYDRFPSSAL